VTRRAPRPSTSPVRYTLFIAEGSTLVHVCWYFETAQTPHRYGCPVDGHLSTCPDATVITCIPCALAFTADKELQRG